MIEQQYSRLPKKEPKKYAVLDGVFCELLDAIIQCYLLDGKRWTKRKIWKALRHYAYRVCRYHKY